MFSCEFGEISKNTFFTEHLRWLLLCLAILLKYWSNFLFWFFPDLSPFLRSCFFIRGCLHVELGWNSSWVEIIPVYGEMSLTAHTFLSRWDFILGWTHPCQKDRDEILSWGEKKIKRTCKHFIPGWSFKMSMFSFPVLTYAFKYAFQS